MIDVTKVRLDAKVAAGAVGHANEDNEFVEAMKELEKEAKAERKRSRKQPHPRRFQRVSARQQNAIGRQ